MSHTHKCVINLCVRVKLCCVARNDLKQNNVYRQILCASVREVGRSSWIKRNKKKVKLNITVAFIRLSVSVQPLKDNVCPDCVVEYVFGVLHSFRTRLIEFRCLFVWLFVFFFSFFDTTVCKQKSNNVCANRV